MEDGGDVFKVDKFTGTLIAEESVAYLKDSVDEDSDSVSWEETGEINFDEFWLCIKNLRKGRASSARTCRTLLDGWNFLEDMARTMGRKSNLSCLINPGLNKIYDKLFCGCKFPAVTPEGKSYSPIWTHEEINIFRREICWAWNEFFPRYLFVGSGRSSGTPRA
jgi:hypothetical protein